MHAKITAYKGIIVCELIARQSIKDEVHTSLDNTGVFGQVIMDTAKHLGASDEAIALLREVRNGTGSLGEIDWFATGDKFAFGWIGGPNTLLDPLKAEGSRDNRVRDGAYITIANDVPAGAVDAIDDMLSKQ